MFWDAQQKRQKTALSRLHTTQIWEITPSQERVIPYISAPINKSTEDFRVELEVLL